MAWMKVRQCTKQNFKTLGARSVSHLEHVPPNTVKFVNLRSLNMIRHLAELTAIALFLASIAVWAAILGH